METFSEQVFIDLELVPYVLINWFFVKVSIGFRMIERVELETERARPMKHNTILYADPMKPMTTAELMRKLSLNKVLRTNRTGFLMLHFHRYVHDSFFWYSVNFFSNFKSVQFL